jgi:tartrate dehydratase alpha subunit/fumarate hydratase class I-like protein
LRKRIQVLIYRKLIFILKGATYEFCFSKGGGSANKTYLYQQTKSLLNEKSMDAFVRAKIMDLGTSACPPYHLAFVIGGTSAEANLAAVKKHLRVILIICLLRVTWQVAFVI